MANYNDFARAGMMNSHGVFKVHDIPPAAYFGPGIMSGVIPQFSFGDVCSRGLWDEAVDEPVAYPFSADKSGFCYIPNYAAPNVRHQIETGVRAAGPPVLVTSFDPNKPQLQSQQPCDIACRWSE